MANRMRRPRFGVRAARRVQARPTAQVGGPGPASRSNTWLGWLAAAAVVALVAFFVGRAGPEVAVGSPTPSPSPAPLAISFGTALDPASGEAIDPTDRFRAGDRIAYSVRLPVPPGVDTVLVEIARLDQGGEAVVQQPSRQGVVATSRIVGFTFAVPTSKLLTAWGAGDYAMRIYLPGATAPFATGRFTLVETPTAP